jgi:murein DD-endopeptidase MepM/ murein hydrolase activator NlpD
MTRCLLALVLLTATLAATAAPPATHDAQAVRESRPTAATTAAALPARAPQGALVIGRTAPGATVEHAGRSVRVSPDGRFVFGIGRDATGDAVVKVRAPGDAAQELRIAIDPRDWPVERIDGVPPKTVDPPPAIAARIAREQAAVSAARNRDDARDDFAQAFLWPVRGRISGRFGNQRVYNGSPKSPHSGMDIAAANGTAVKAPAAGIVTFAAPDLYLTGGTVLIDHGAGVSSNFLHLSRIDVKVGDRVTQGQVFGAVGATGRATGPHLHWGMNWFDVRVDPLLVLEASGAAAQASP